jgi:hypothetical protein
VPVTDADGRGVWQSAGVTAGNRGLPGLRAGWPVKTRMTAVAAGARPRPNPGRETSARPWSSSNDPLSVPVPDRVLPARPRPLRPAGAGAGRSSPEPRATGSPGYLVLEVVGWTLGDATDERRFVRQRAAKDEPPSSPVAYRALSVRKNPSAGSVLPLL